LNGDKNGILVGANAGTITSTGSFTPSGTVQSLNGGVSQTAMNVTQPTMLMTFYIKL
jgi:hypothetical protein